jgi:hypothetical protein
MNAYESARHIGRCFDDDQIEYAIGGALALGVWGAPRATIDVDISAFVPRAELARVLDSLERAGVLIRRADAARDVERVGFFKGRLGRVVVDVFLSEHPQYLAMQKRVHRFTDLEGWTLSVISPEDLCIHKLLFGRDKDVADLERLLATRELDLRYIRTWLTQMVPAGDRRIAVLDDLERRFATR